MVKRVTAWALRVGALVCLAVLVVLLYVGMFGVPLQVDVENGAIWVDTQVLGEYYTSLSRIRLTDTKTGATVWEATSIQNDGLTPVWKFSLIPGENELPERLVAGFRTIVPEHKATFVLTPGRRYRIDVWGANWLHHNARSFVAPTSQAS